MTKLTILVLALIYTTQSFSQYKATTAEERSQSAAKRKILQQSTYLKDVKFRNIGPTIMSGRVVDLDVNPADPTEFYAAFATGGLWYTNNNGLSFTPVFDQNPHLFMGDIAVDWKSGNIWVGTGEVNSSRSSYAGDGVYRSRDRGKTWEYMGLSETHHIGKILLHPTDGNIAWVAAMGHLYSFNRDRGVFKTTDGGKSWKHTLMIDDKTGVVDLDYDPLNPDLLYATAWYRTRTAWNFEEGSRTSGIYKSTDGGNNWNLISKTANGFPADTFGRMGIAVYPKNAKIVYAVVDNQSKKPGVQKDTSKVVTETRYLLRDLRNLNKQQFLNLDEPTLDSFLVSNRFPKPWNAKSIKAKVADGTFKPTVVYDYLKGPNEELLDASAIKGCEVYRSDDGGNQWKKVNTTPLDRMYSTYGYYFGTIYVSPVNPDKVLIAGVSLMLSEDGGKTFKNMDGKIVHADHHTLWINPNRDSHMINGNDGGVNITYDNGAAWFKVTSVPAGQFYSITVDNAKPYNVYGGLQDNGVWYGPSNAGTGDEWLNSGMNPYRNIAGGDGMMVQVDTRDNQTFYTGSQFGAYFRNNKERTAQKSIRPRHQLGETPLRFNWETPIHLSRHNQDVIYMGSNRFHRSLNKADTIENLTGDLTKGGKSGDVPYGTLTCVTESPMRFGLLYAGSDDGLVHVSRDGGYSWTRIINKLPQELWVSCITPSTYKEGRVYLSLNGYRYDHFNPYLFVSEDYGSNWTPLHANLPMESINVIREDPRQENILYIGTDQGLYATIDRGKYYMPFVTDLPRVPVHDIAIQQRENEIVLGTHGRSIYIAKLDSVQQLLTSKTYFEKKKAEADKFMTVIRGQSNKELYRREGVELDCPAVSF